MVEIEEAVDFLEHGDFQHEVTTMGSNYGHFWQTCGTYRFDCDTLFFTKVADSRAPKVRAG
jgi:hypothetical protein